MNHITALCEVGLLRKETRKGNSSNVFFLTLDGGVPPATGVVQEMHPEPVTLLNRSLNQLRPRLPPRSRRVRSFHSLPSSHAVKSRPICRAPRTSPARPSRPGPTTPWLTASAMVHGRYGTPGAPGNWARSSTVLELTSRTTSPIFPDHQRRATRFEHAQHRRPAGQGRGVSHPVSHQSPDERDHRPKPTSALPSRPLKRFEPRRRQPMLNDARQEQLLLT